MKIPIDQIEIGERQRTDLGDLSDSGDLGTMADPNIKQIVAITVQRKLDGGFLLVAGNRRLHRAKLLGWTHIEAYDIGDLDPVVKQEMELYEDVGRKDRTWKERCLAVAKLFRLKAAQKAELGESWTVRTMAVLTGDSKSNIAYMLQVAKELENPTSSIHECEGFFDAIKWLIKRAERETNAEIERRRQATMGSEVHVDMAQPGTDRSVLATYDDGELVGLEPFEDPVPQEPVQGLDKTIITIRALAAMPSEPYRTVIGYNTEIQANPTQDGFLVEWWDDLSFLCFFNERTATQQPYPIIWSRYMTQTPATEWPFAANYSIGLVFAGPTAKPIQEHAVSSHVMSVQPKPGVLPRIVVHHTLNAIGIQNAPVLCLGDIDLTAVVEWGAVPVFVEPDDAKREAKSLELEAHYRGQIANVEFRRLM